MSPCDIRCLRREIEEYRLLLDQLPPGGSWRTAALEKRLRRIADRLAEELWEISKWIADIPDPELRLIFELRWFRGFSWAEVAENLPTALSADGARMKYSRYLKSKKSAEADFFDRPVRQAVYHFSNRKEGSAG